MKSQGYEHFREHDSGARWMRNGGVVVVVGGGGGVNGKEEG